MISFSETPVVKNVLGGPLEMCCGDPKTGFFRDGFCHTNLQDEGAHVVCAIMTDDFLSFSKECGNDLSTPRPEFDFPGLKDGDGWCLCALRWLQAYEAGCAPKLNPRATHERALQYIPIGALEQHFIES